MGFLLYRNGSNAVMTRSLTPSKLSLLTRKAAFTLVNEVWKLHVYRCGWIAEKKPLVFTQSFIHVVHNSWRQHELHTALFSAYSARNSVFSCRLSCFSLSSFFSLFSLGDLSWELGEQAFLWCFIRMFWLLEMIKSSHVNSFSSPEQLISEDCSVLICRYYDVWVVAHSVRHQGVLQRHIPVHILKKMPQKYLKSVIRNAELDSFI